ncbi:branched-chain-amino-acid aminotransferase-like protein 2 isoform X2 [Bradysia coprophila]|uniref:branched-chain-amino-acid aminotransferase-like protein 2 isoform X2 n=1 Tax=Bradysia coprophila TaxID=38358 RepID=UPI00187D9F46|nr:branched-chain-amino-acid aminotransferase-like protein 2 isoform X2 [Bradysia coprophila]
MKKLPVVLWCHPRSVSTAFERAFLQREDFYCLHEPFGDAYYFGPQRQSLRYKNADLPNDIKLTSTTFQFVCDEIRTARPGKRTFVKDMAYHVFTYLKDHELPIDKMISTFLIRNPFNAVPSMYKCSISDWGSFDPTEMGYLKQRDLFDHVMNRYRQTPIVVNSEELVKNPRAVLQKYCALVDIEYKECMIEWKPMKIEQFDKWTGWHERNKALALQVIYSR